MIFGYTSVDFDGYTNGKESETEVFSSKEARDDAAYKEYKECFNMFEFEDGVDENGKELMDKESFLEEIYNTEAHFVVIQDSDSHIQIEFFETEV